MKRPTCETVCSLCFHLHNGATSTAFVEQPTEPVALALPLPLKAESFRAKRDVTSQESSRVVTSTHESGQEDFETPRVGLVPVGSG